MTFTLPSRLIAIDLQDFYELVQHFFEANTMAMPIKAVPDSRHSDIWFFYSHQLKERFAALFYTLAFKAGVGGRTTSRTTQSGVYHPSLFTKVAFM